jgi:hypothetical protein
MALESQLVPLRAAARELADGETPAAIKKAHKKAVDDMIARGTSALEGREEAFAAAGRTSARVASWREDANRALLGIEGALKQIASERKLGTDWVDAFFPIPERTKKTKGKSPDESSSAPS